MEKGKRTTENSVMAISLLKPTIDLANNNLTLVSERQVIGHEVKTSTPRLATQWIRYWLRW